MTVSCTRMGARALPPMRWWLGLALVSALLALAPAARAWELAGHKDITAVTRDQQHIALGSVVFTPVSGGGAGVTVAMDYSRFVDHFLSMKEFKCLQGSDEVLCHVPYPYRNPATVKVAGGSDGTGAGDYAWLEHQLLFLFKQPRDFGAKLWNGLYFHLEPDALGLVGTPQAVDLNLISGPPDDLQTPPYGPMQRDPVQPGSHWIERILIR